MQMSYNQIILHLKIFLILVLMLLELISNNIYFEDVFNYRGSYSDFREFKSS